ncbi:unnamed protein product [Brassicogethes aeneus]|uniref:Carboxylic ester hydrolase n=1 Tax=Brassicogethes aeneus TaxID=1431903 RepID=A0A9P0B818_BRAAE|nr:unnamed protein product [Brassicogethes aeneus]
MISCNVMLVILATCNVGYAGVLQEDPIVETEYGNVRGSIKESRNGRNFFSFTGIPYAKPPIGELRFKTPQKLERWSEILDAQQDAPHCIQKNYLFANPKIEGQEDCLYLNVFTPQIRTKRNVENTGLMPVMVFIHWGGYVVGYSSTGYLGPEYFMDKNIILVTFNYRLGVMGFLSTNDDEAPGNYGLKDQVAVLKWVKENIKYFGGNPDQVTIFGQSAGGASVHYHMLSPLTKNLFHKGISQSGSALSLWCKPLGAEQLIVTKMQAQIVNCNSNSTTREMVDCLRKIDAADLVESMKTFKFFSIDPINVYMPSIEKLTKMNPDPFITKTPQEYIRNREYKNIPWVLGLVNNEGLIRAEALLRQSSTRKSLNANFDGLMPFLMALQLSVPKKELLITWEKIKGFYFRGKSHIDISNPESVKSLIDLYTDRSFAYSMYQSALYHKYHGHDKIWFYNFNYKGENSYGDAFAATNETLNYSWGVSHCDELIYLFKSPALFSNELNTNDKQCSEDLITMWTNFASNGTPNENWSEMNNFENNTSKNIKYLSIEGLHEGLGPEYSMTSGLHKSRFKFWEHMALVENLKELNETIRF